MTKIHILTSSEYGIMFLYDSQVKPKFPVEAGKLPVMATSTCLAFSVLIYVDGEASVVICDSTDSQSLNEYFSGEIECPSRSISIYDHTGFGFISVPLKEGRARVSLRMSEERNPHYVECVIGNMETF